MGTVTISKDKLRAITAKFADTKIMVVGDIMLDEYMWGDVNRISPEAPVPVVAVEEITHRLGGASNVIQNLSRLGITPVLVSVIGDDTNGAQLQAMLSENNCVNDYLCVSKTRPTSIKTRIMARQQQVVRADRESCDDLTEGELCDITGAFEKAVNEVQGVIISDYGKGVICPAFLETVIKTCREKGLFVAVDPKERHFDLYKGVTVITPNLREAYTALGIPLVKRPTDSEIKELGFQLVEKLDLSFLLLTLSERGMALFEKEGSRFTHLSTVARKVFDVTGAGDTVISAYSAAAVCGATPFEAAFIANHAAGITVAELGTASVETDALIRACLE